MKLSDLARPLVLIGGLPRERRAHVRAFVERLGAHVYAEPLSGLRELVDGIRNERMLATGRFDGVIRIGNVPTLRYWRDLDDRFRDLPVFHFSDLPFTGLPRGEVLPLDALPLDVAPRERDDELTARDREQWSRVIAVIESEPRSELAMLRAIAHDIDHGARIYLGNSLPIREWDMVAPRDDRGFELEANRGANGIDGQLSTFLGWCAPGASNWCFAGDLTTLYDLNAPWVVPQLDADFRIVIVNNGGGRIFSRVKSLEPLRREFREATIENAHELRFGAWASMWGIERNVIELLPDADASARVWHRYDELWR